VAWYSLPFVGSLPSGYDPPRHVCAYPTNPALPIPYPGMYGQSSVREVALDTGAALRTKALARSEFGEGLVKVGNRCAAEPWLGTHSPKAITGHPARASGLFVVVFPAPCIIRTDGMESCDTIVLLCHFAAGQAAAQGSQ